MHPYRAVSSEFYRLAPEAQIGWFSGRNCQHRRGQVGPSGGPQSNIRRGQPRIDLNHAVAAAVSGIAKDQIDPNITARLRQGLGRSESQPPRSGIERRRQWQSSP